MKIRIIYFSVFLILLSACSKDWLEIKPIARMTQDEYKNSSFADTSVLSPENAQASLDGAYIPYAYQSPWGASFWVGLNCLAGDANVGGGAAGDRPEFEELNHYTVNASSLAPQFIWQKLYKCVNAVNLLMRDAKGVNDPKLDPILAEAQVLRAFYFFDLIRFFGDIPYVRTEVSEDIPTGRTDWHTILDDQIQTVNENVGLLVDKNADGKFNQAAAYTLLGKMNMWKGDYQAAADALSKVVSNPRFGLLDNYEDVFNYADQFNKEVIFTIPYDGSLGYDFGGWTKTSNIDVKLCGIRSLAWNGDPNEQILDGWGFIKPRPDIVDAFIAANDKVRLNANIFIADQAKDNDMFTLKFYQIATWSDDYGYEGYFRKKYSDYAAIPHSGDGCGMNEIVYRYSDVLLLMVV